MTKACAVRTNGLMMGVALVLTVPVGCGGPGRGVGQGPLALARQYIAKEQYQPAVQVLSTFIAKPSGANEVGTAHYLRGLAYAQMEPARNKLAQEDFEQALAKAHKKKELAALAHVGLGHLYFESRPDEQERAVEHYEAALSQIDADEETQAVVLYRQGVALQRLGRWEEADRYLSQTFDRFGESTYGGYAREHFGSRAWRLQFGAFAVRERAVKLVEQLKRDGTQADWAPRRREGGVLYTVQAGRYGTYRQARQALAAVHGAYRQTQIVAAP